MKIYQSSGIILKDKDWEISCDITKHRQTPLLFISHAHSDHITKRPPQTEIICSPITKALTEHFVPKISSSTFITEKIIKNTSFKQISSGHTAGSTALIIDSPKNKIIFTSDVSIREKGFVEPFKPEKCDILIVEATFGDPKYSFPPYVDEIKRARELIKNHFEEGRPCVLMGYAYGKAQMLYHNFADLSETIILHGANYHINSVLSKVDEQSSVKCISYQYAKEKNIMNESKDWILFTPLKSGRDAFNVFLKDKFDVKLFAFSGWCYDSNYKYRMGVDHTITISDHPDFKELIELCKACEPGTIYTVYGSNFTLSAELRKRGFKAYPLSKKQSTLDTFFA